jgi:hypothetical protein
MGPRSSDDDGGRRGREERVGVRGVAAGILIVFWRTVGVALALTFLGVGGASDSSSSKTMGRLDFGFVGARLRFRLRGGFGMARWVQRRSASRGWSS